MPHVVIEGNISPRAIWERFEPVDTALGPDIVKIQRAFLDRDENVVLFEALTVSQGMRQKFFVQASRKGVAGVTVRLEAMTVGGLWFQVELQVDGRRFFPLDVYRAPNRAG